jgi:hypothetical protein
MPQHKGVEPFMYIWIVQVAVSYKPLCFDNSTCSKSFACTDSRVVFFGEQRSHDDFLEFLNHQTAQQSRIIRLVHDYGRQRWFNDKLWILFTLQNVYINGNFDPSFKPTV